MNIAETVKKIGGHQVALKEATDGIKAEIQNLADSVGATMKRLWDEIIGSDEVHYQELDTLMFASGCHVVGWKPDPISLALYSGEKSDFGGHGEYFIFAAEGKWHLVKWEEVPNKDSEYGYDYKRVESVTDSISVNPDLIQNFLDALSEETGLVFEQYRHKH